MPYHRAIDQTKENKIIQNDILVTKKDTIRLLKKVTTFQ